MRLHSFDDVGRTSRSAARVHAGLPEARARAWAPVPRLLVLAFALAAAARPATVSPLFARGYAVLPQPQTVALSGGDFHAGPEFRLELEGVAADDVAVATLKETLHVTGSGGTAIRLVLAPGAVEFGQAADRDRDALAQEAYSLDLAPAGINVRANAPPGLFYGVETLLQLLDSRGGQLPEGRIADWPDLEYRAIYWDDAHHLERLDELKRAVRTAARFKINAFAIKLEGHFQYKSAAALVEPYALSPAEFQELTDYGLRYHVQVVPYLDAPAHIAFILKHPEYAALREYPQSNYELCVTNPDSYKLLFGMYQDLLDANRGGKYFYLSTDEPYYIGLADNPQCREAARARELGSVGKLLGEFMTKAAGYLHERGRQVIFWGEYPLKPDDIPSLPNYLINGETYGPAFDPLFRKHGIRSMIYSSTQGMQDYFPEYYVLPRPRRLHAGSRWSPRVEENFNLISFTPARGQADLMGMTNAGWADNGLHPETFWLGYATSGAFAWHPGAPGPEEAVSTFIPIYYGHGVSGMERVYQLMSTQAQVWTDSWDRVPSTARKPIFGNSEGVYDKPKPAHDQALPLPPVPSAEMLTATSSWAEQNARRLDLAATAMAENDELLGLLHSNLALAQRNRYNLEVFVSVAQLCRQNLRMIATLEEIDRAVKAPKTDPKEAVEAIDRALTAARAIRQERNRALADAVETWYKSWYPRVAEANGRRFLHQLDDVKDHPPDRTVDMSFLVYRELLLPLDKWYSQVQSARNQYARKHGLPEASGALEWRSTAP